MLSEDLLHDYQVRAADYALANPYNALWLSMGLGKTVSVLTSLRTMIATGEVRKVLILAPKLVANHTWPDEIETWGHLRGLRYARLTGTRDQRHAMLHHPAPIHLINHENLVWLWQALGKDRWPYDMVVIDESSRGYKNPKRRTVPKKGTKGKRNLTRFGAAVNVRHLPITSRVVELTGTPAPNGHLDLWAQIYLLDKGERLGQTFEMYKRRYFQENPYSYEITPLPGALDEINRRVSDITLSMSEHNYLDLPERIYQVETVTLPRKAKEQYDYFRRHFIMEHHDDVEAESAGVLVNKLLQLCIAGGTPVLTRRGWVPIEYVGEGDEVWDGEAWVPTEGAIAKGRRATVDCFGVSMTPDHEVLTRQGWATAEDVRDGDASHRYDRADVRLPDGVVPPREGPERLCDVGVPLRLRRGGRADRRQPPQQESRAEEIMWVSSRRDAFGCLGGARDDRFPPVDHLGQHAPAVQQPEGQGFQELRCARHHRMPPLGGFLCELLGRHEARVSGAPDDRPEGQRERVQPRELPMGDAEDAAPQHARERAYRHPLGGGDRSGSRRAKRAQASHDLRSDPARVAGESSARTPERAVYDLLDCGPRNRFVVWGAEGPLIVHNCNGSVYNDEGEDIWIHDAKLEALKRIVEEAQADGEQLLVAYAYEFDKQRIKTAFPKAVVLGEDPDALDKWNARTAGMMICHPASAGHGLNLQKGGRLQVWYGLTWDLELYLQLNKRLHRGDQQEPVIIKHIVAARTDDERVLPRLTEKNATQDKLLRAVAA